MREEPDQPDTEDRWRDAAKHWQRVADAEATRSHEETRMIIRRLRTENQRLKRLLTMYNIGY